MQYAQVTAFAVFSAIAAGLIGLGFFPGRAGPRWSLLALGFVFICIASLAWPHQIVIP